MRNLRWNQDLAEEDRRKDALIQLDRCDGPEALARWTTRWREGLHDLLSEPEAACPDTFDSERSQLAEEANDAEARAYDIAEAGKALVSALTKEPDLSAKTVAALNRLEELCA